MMKKLISVLAAALLTASAAYAQFGVIGGFTSSSTSINTKDIMANLNGVSLWHVGAAYRVELGSFFALQPQLAYQVKGANVGQTITEGTYQNAMQSFYSNTGYLELSLGLQAGVDLLVFRPYFLFEPFIGYAVNPGTENYNITGEGILNGSVSKEDINAAVASVKNKLEYGFGIGAGIHLLDHFQVSLQWFMNLGSLYDNGKIDGEAKLATVKDSYQNIKNYQGLKLTLGLFF